MGIAGIVALGTTGEPAALDAAEQDAVLLTILDAANGLSDAPVLPVIVGVSGNHTATMRERISEINQMQVAGILVAAPYYIRPSQAGIVGHFTALADASEKPIVLYDIPYRTGVRLELETLLRLAAHPRIQAIKDCSGSLDTTLALIRDGRLQVLAGEDVAMYNTICLGGAGAIAASAHLWPERFVKMFNELNDDRLADGRRTFFELLPLIQAAFAEPNPAPIKAALATQGLICDELRMPMTRASAEVAAQLSAIHSPAALGY